MAKQPKKRGPGRPARGPYTDKRKTLTTRITADMREALEDAAKKADRSLSQEIELRLEQSFRVGDLFGGGQNLAEAAEVWRWISTVRRGVSRAGDDPTRWRQYVGVAPPSEGRDEIYARIDDAVSQRLAEVEQDLKRYGQPAAADATFKSAREAERAADRRTAVAWRDRVQAARKKSRSRRR